jgi:hypothetical protein
MADLWNSSGDHHPVKAGKNSRNLVRIPFRQHDHGRTLQACRDTCLGNTKSVSYPSLRDLFGSGSAGLGELDGSFEGGLLERLPMPLTSADRQAGYDWRLSIWQMKVSLTQVFDRPVEGRKFFEEVIRDNLDLGRPDRVQLLFERRITKSTPGAFRTR